MSTTVDNANFASLASASAPAAGGKIGASNYIDLTGGEFSISGGALQDNAQGTDFTRQWAVLPTSANTLNQSYVATFSPGTQTPILHLRVNASSFQSYGIFYDSNGNLLGHLFYGGNHGAISGAAATFAYSDADGHILTATASGQNPTTLTASLAKASAPGTVIASWSTTEGSSIVQNAGTFGISGTNSWGGCTSLVATNTGGSSPTPTPTPTATVSVTPTTATAGVPVNVFLSGANTSWGGSTAMRIVSGGTNAYLSNYATNGQTLTATLNPGSAAGTIALGDSTDSATANLTVSVSPSVNILWIGDSLTYGVNGSGGGGIGATRVATVLNGLGPIATGQNQGQPGWTIGQQMIPNLSSYNSVYDSTKTHNVAVVCGGHNDFYHGASIAQVESYIQQLVIGLTSVHPWSVVWATELPSAFPGYPSNFDPMRDAVNTYIRANWRSLGISALSDVAGDARIGLDACEYNSTYYSSSDNCHLTDAGYTVWGQYDLAAVQQAIASPESSLIATTYYLDVAQGVAQGNTAIVNQPCLAILTLPLGTIPPAGLQITATPTAGLTINGSTSPVTLSFAPTGRLVLFLNAMVPGNYTFTLSNNAGLVNPPGTYGVTYVAAQVASVAKLTSTDGVGAIATHLPHTR